MKLKNVKNISNNVYPKRKELDNKELKNNIPSRWKKIGITSFVFGLIMSTKANANEIYDKLPTPGSQRKEEDELPLLEDIQIIEENEKIEEDELPLSGDIQIVEKNDEEREWENTIELNNIKNETIIAGGITTDDTSMPKTIGTITAVVSITGVVAISSLIGITAFKIKKRKKDK